MGRGKRSEASCRQARATPLSTNVPEYQSIICIPRVAANTRFSRPSDPADPTSNVGGNIVAFYDDATDRIIVHFVRGVNSNNDCVPGNSNWEVYSLDDGLSWSTPRDISTFLGDFVGVLPGPGVGIQLKKGPNAGRLVVPGHYGTYAFRTSECVKPLEARSEPLISFNETRSVHLARDLRNTTGALFSFTRARPVPLPSPFGHIINSSKTRCPLAHLLTIALAGTAYRDYGADIVYWSDDSGATWTVTKTPLALMDEDTVVEIGDSGAIMLNMRNADLVRERDC